MYMLFWLVVALVGAAIQFEVRRHRGRDTAAAHLLLNWLLFSALGLAGLVAVVAHTAFASESARGIGFPAGNPFQYEVAVANLAIAVLALIAFWAHGAFTTAAGLTGGIWLGGDAIVHTHELVVHGNDAPNNAGLFLIVEAIIAIALLALTAYTATQWRIGLSSAASRPRTSGG
jgi:hypothetical protein